MRAPMRFADRPFASFAASTAPARRSAAGVGPLALQVRYAWGDQLLHVSQHARPAKVLVGSTPRCDLFVASDRLDASETELLDAADDGWELRLGPGMRGEIDRDGSRRQVGPGIYALEPSDFARVDLVGITAEIAFAHQPRRAALPWVQRVDIAFLNLTLLATFVAGVFVVSALGRTEADVVADDLAQTRLLYRKVFLSNPDPSRPATGLLQVPSPSASTEQVGGAHDGAPGRAGRRDAPKQDGRLAVRPIRLDGESLGGAPRGLLGAIAASDSSVFRGGGLGGDLKDAAGHLVGAVTREANGLGGLGLRDAGAGGGGFAKTFGIGAIDIIGGGMAGHGVSCAGRELTGCDPRLRALPTSKELLALPVIDEGAAVVCGGLFEGARARGCFDKELIRKVIRGHLDQVRYCYESALQSHPGLAGKLAVRFVIGPDGTVRSAASAPGTTLNAANVHGCVLSRLREWVFPKPKGGGEAIVIYPFLFAQAGG